ncbi:MAG: YeeE/YedE thiosulfate transporter family protein [Synechococcus sp. ELA057]
MQLSIGVVVALLFLSGLLISQVRFCMVNAVARAGQGQWDIAQAIALICLSISAVLMALEAAQGRVPHQLAPDWQVAAGGLLFGIAAAWNRGCFIGSSLQLAAGDLRVLLTMGGWVLGFLIAGKPMALSALAGMSQRTAVALAGCLILLGLMQLANRQDSPEPPLTPRDRVAWPASLACGALLALVDNDLWRWDPSSLALAVANHLRGQTTAPLLGLMLLAGMATESLLRRRTQITLPRLGDLVRLPLGMAMAAGAVLAMGGNDSQLLRYLPGGSPHGLVAVATMVAGIVIGLRSTRWRTPQRPGA